MAFWRCPCCGRWAPLEAFRRAATTGHELGLGTPGGRNTKWKLQPMPAAAKKILITLLKAIVARMEVSDGE